MARSNFYSCDTDLSTKIRIAVDAMSGDLGPRVVISALQSFVTFYYDIDLLLVGDQSQLQKLIAINSPLSTRIKIVHAPDVVTMSDDPISAVRQKKSSSMWAALALLRDGAADACVSAGNTGALLAMSKYLIKTYPLIERPAICKAMPVEDGLTYLLDLGANINCTATQLQQFAVMGSVLAKLMGIELPRVALLNIGRESQKGTELLQLAQDILRSDNRIYYTGFVEPNSLFSGEQHVIVCDGFHGNIALKASEGAANYVSKKITKILQRNILNKFLSFIAAPLFRELSDALNPSLYNGATFLGLQKTVIKSHGGADAKAFLQALAVAREQVLLQVPDRIAQKLSEH